MVSISDKIGKASDGTGYVHITTVKTARTVATMTLECYDLSKASTTTPVFFMTYKKVVDPVTEEVTISNQTSWKALVNIATNTFTDMQVAPGYTDVGNEVGDFVEFMPTSFWEDSLVDGLLVAHNQDGTHKTNMTLTTNAATLTSPKVITSINDTNNNELIAVTATASAVNEITVTNAATGTAPSISATGGDSAVNLNLRGKGLAKTVTIGAGAATIFPYDFVLSGCVWTADAAGSTRLASMTSGVVVINGNPVTVAAVTSRTFTASKDVYVDVLDNGDGTGLLVYTDATTNAASPALASNSVRLAIIVVGASSIATAASINQGQEDRVLPIASSTPYAVTDSLGNLICPRDPNRKILGYRQQITSFTFTTNATVTKLVCPVIVPAGRKIKVSVYSDSIVSSSIANLTGFLYDGATTGGTQISQLESYNPVANGPTCPFALSAVVTPTATSKTYSVSASASAGTGTLYMAATLPGYIMVELV